MKTKKWFVYCLLQSVNGKNLAETVTEEVKLSLVQAGTVAAIVSPVFSPKERKVEKEDLTKHFNLYQKINAWLFNSHTIVPVKFGTLAASKAHIRELLEKANLQIQTELDHLKGKAEFVVLTYWEPYLVLGQIREKINEKKDGPMQGKTESQLGRKILERMEREKLDIIETLHGRLKPIALDYSDSKLTSSNMIMHRSYLILKEEEVLLDEVMSSLGTILPEHISLTYHGPIPPYSFVHLKVSKSDYRLLNGAREALSLPDKVSLKEVKTAYRKLSLNHHPDRNPNDAGAEERFKKITEAFKTLQAYCEGSGDPDENGAYSLKKEDVKKRLIATKS